MKKLIFFISLCLFVSCTVSAQTLQLRVNQVIETANKNEAEIKEIESKIDELYDHFDNLEYAIDKQKDIIAQEQSVIDNSLSSASHALSIFSYILGAIGVLITVLGIWLSIYISNKQKNVEALLQTVEEKKNAIESLNTIIEGTSRVMQRLNEDMNNNIEGLYQRLRREETVTLLNRLVDVPEDIVNISTILFARKLNPEDFDLLLKAYEKLMSENSKYAEQRPLIGPSPKEGYLLLFFQHFCGKAIQSSSLKKDIISVFPMALQCAFRADIKNSLSSLIEALNTTNIDVENILAQYVIALHSSKHKTYTEPYQLIVNNCNDTINLQFVWDKLVNKNVIIEPFGNMLSTKYKANSEFVTKVKEQIEASRKVEKKKKGAA